ncbi:unnamed protein product [Nesidiocoris tenuis]|uniref:Cytochrome b561 domain-containing protein n=1 Tax=Nesidiocoris tenuis TaxID=355587 RepID=A0A6H5H2K1_9HEMI|nr:unnamed protein product [Nesidiocoris tenuis]
MESSSLIPELRLQDSFGPGLKFQPHQPTRSFFQPVPKPDSDPHHTRAPNPEAARSSNLYRCSSQFQGTSARTKTLQHVNLIRHLSRSSNLSYQEPPVLSKGLQFLLNNNGPHQDCIQAYMPRAVVRNAYFGHELQATQPRRERPFRSPVNAWRALHTRDLSGPSNKHLSYTGSHCQHIPKKGKTEFFHRQASCQRKEKRPAENQELRHFLKFQQRPTGTENLWRRVPPDSLWKNQSSDTNNSFLPIIVNYDSDDDDMSCGHWCEYVIVVVLSSILLVASLVLVLFWCLYYRKGYAWNDNPKIQFNLHPTLMIAGFIFFSGFSMLLYRISRCCRRIYVKLLHTLFHTLAIPCVVLGFMAVLDYHNLADPPIPNFYSIHSWMGFVTMGLFALQFVVGFFSFLLLLCCDSATAGFRASLVPVHATFGLTTFMLAVATCLTGLTEAAYFNFGLLVEAFKKRHFITTKI